MGLQMESFSFSFFFSFFTPPTFGCKDKPVRVYCTLLYCVLYCTVQYCTVLYCTVLYCTVLYCTVLYCTVLYCTVLYCTVLTFLGVNLSEKLDWKQFLMDGRPNLYNQLKARVSAIKKLRTNCSFAFACNLATALWIGKFNYAAELWGGAPKYIIKKFQSLQLEAAQAVIGPK